MTKYILKIDGMDCVEEVGILKKAIGPLVDGDEHLRFDVIRGKMFVDALSQNVSIEDVISSVNQTGMKAHLWTDSELDSKGKSNLKTCLTVISGVLIASGFIIHIYLSQTITEPLGISTLDGSHSTPSLVIVFYALASFLGLWLVFPKALYAAKRFSPDMNLLMTIAVIGAMFINEWFEAAIVTFLFSASLLIESWSVARARRAVESLVDLSSNTVRLIEEGKYRDVDPKDVEVGSHIIVKPGERIPLDGIVFQSEGYVDQSPITGESVPVKKEHNSEVFAGTINGETLLEVATTKRDDETTLANMIRLVSEAQSRRSPSEKWVDKFARWYTPTVVIIAILICIFPPLVLDMAWNEWVYRSLVLLVIACPCALVISTPVSVVTALAAAARNGVLVKGGVFMEAPAYLRAICLDKTGTLTHGNPTVQKIVPLNGHTEDELLIRAAAMEANSGHPLARAIVNCAKERGLNYKIADEFEIIPGKGARGTFDDREFWLGSHRYLEERGQETPEIHRMLVEMSDAGHTVVVIGNSSHVCGLISISDAVRDGARQTMIDLRESGIEHIVMLTGDNEGTANAVANAVGVDDVRAELLPEDKVAAVEELVNSHSNVAMIGDGVNDAPAMARASVGFAMGAAGSDVAIETADIALMSDDLSKMPWLIRHSRRMLKIIHQNIYFSLFVKAAFIILTFVGFASLWMAIVADMGATLLVVFNGMRLLSGK